MDLPEQPELADSYINPSWGSRDHSRGQSRQRARTSLFTLDGRWLHAFNGPGMTTNAVHANFRYNGS